MSRNIFTVLAMIYPRIILGIIVVLLNFVPMGISPAWPEEAQPLTKDIKTVEAKPADQAAKPPEEEKPTGDFSTSVLSKYIWRGYESSRNSVVVQPSVTVGYKGFSINAWGNVDTNPYYAGNQAGKSYASTWTETDLTLSYSKTIGLFNLGVGYIYYGLGALNQDTVKRADAQEVYVSIGLNTILSPTLTAYKEFTHYRNEYFLFAISQGYDFNKIVSIKFAASASYLKSEYADANLFNAGAGYGGYPKFDDHANATNDTFSNFHDGNVSLSLPIKPVKYVTITPIISYSFPLTGEARDEIRGQGLQGVSANTDRDSSFLYGGVTFQFSF